MYKTIKNDNSGVVHAAYGSHAPVSFCGAIHPYSEDITVAWPDSGKARDAAITCKNCLRMLGLPDERRPTKPKKAKWVANYLGDINASKPWGFWDDIEFEMSVCRSNYTEGREAAGWFDLNKKIVIFTSDDYAIETVPDLKWMKQIVEAMAEGMNEKGL